MADVVARSVILDWETMLPAVAQGAVGIQCRKDDPLILPILKALNDPVCEATVLCERAFLRALDGNCRTPIAGQAVVENGCLKFEGLIALPNGRNLIRSKVYGDLSKPEQLGLLAAEEIKKMAGVGFSEFQNSIRGVMQSPSP